MPPFQVVSDFKPTGDQPAANEALVKGVNNDLKHQTLLGATGTGTYTANGDVAQVSLTFEGLMLDGVYTLWCSQIVLPPDFEILNTPCGAPDGSENVFEADADGNAHIDLEIAARPYTTEEILSVFAIAYHSNGQTYGEYPGDFSLNSHVQLFVPLPSAEG